MTPSTVLGIDLPSRNYNFARFIIELTHWPPLIALLTWLWSRTSDLLISTSYTTDNLISQLLNLYRWDKNIRFGNTLPCIIWSCRISSCRRWHHFWNKNTQEAQKWLTVIILMYEQNNGILVTPHTWRVGFRRESGVGIDRNSEPKGENASILERVGIARRLALRSWSSTVPDCVRKIVDVDSRSAYCL